MKLGDVCCKIGSGATPRGGDVVYLEDGDISLIRSQNVYNDGFHHDGLVYITEDHAKELNNVEIKEDDVLLNITGDSVARCCQVDPNVIPARVNQHVAIIRPDPKQLDPVYLRYFLISEAMQQQMLSWADSGGTRKALTKSMIESFEIDAPSNVAEQYAISSVLKSLDDKISLNHKINETLEAIAKSIFKSWFVDFDPVHAKMAGKKPVGMDDATAALFPDSFEESELGKIPKGWKAKKSSDVLEINPERALRKGTVAPYIEMKMLPTSGLQIQGAVDRPFSSGQKFVNGDVLFARITPCLENGKTAYVNILKRDDQVAWGSTEYIVLRSKQPFGTEYAYLLARHNDFRAHAIQNMTGTSGRQRVQESCFDHYILPCPTEPIAIAFTNIIAPIFEHIKNSGREIIILSSIRDLLLPKLISGEIEVK